MSRNSTLILWNYLLEKQNTSFDHLIYNEKDRKKFSPKKQTINRVLAYAKSLDVVRTRSGNSILINLN